MIGDYMTRGRILIIGTHAQIRVLENYPHLVAGDITPYEVSYCSNFDHLGQMITGSDTPGDKETWDLPERIYLTGQIRVYSGGFSSTMDDISWFNRHLREKYGIEDSRIIKIDMDFP